MFRSCLSGVSNCVFRFYTHHRPWHSSQIFCTGLNNEELKKHSFTASERPAAILACTVHSALLRLVLAHRTPEEAAPRSWTAIWPRIAATRRRNVRRQKRSLLDAALDHKSSAARKRSSARAATHVNMLRDLLRSRTTRVKEIFFSLLRSTVGPPDRGTIITEQNV